MKNRPIPPKHKRLIQMTDEAEKRMVNNDLQRIQQYANELANVQGRRCEAMMALAASHVAALPGGVRDMTPADLDKCRELANYAIDADARQKWEGLRDLFDEQGIEGAGQGHMTRAAKLVGVNLFNEEPALVHPASVVDIGQASH